MTEAQVDALVAKLKDMVKEADAKYEVTVAMLKRSARCKHCLSMKRINYSACRISVVVD